MRHLGTIAMEKGLFIPIPPLSFFKKIHASLKADSIEVDLESRSHSCPSLEIDQEIPKVRECSKQPKKEGIRRTQSVEIPKGFTRMHGLAPSEPPSPLSLCPITTS